MTTKRILVTGASGFVGAHLAVGLSSFGHIVAACGGQKQCCAEVRARSSVVYQGELSNSEFSQELISDFCPEIIVHAAALANVSLCQKNPSDAKRSNVETTRQLLNLAAQNAKFIYLSTDMVFDGRDAPQGGFTEQEPPAPATVYSKTKAEAENLVKDSGGVVCRLSLVYGLPIGGQEGFLGWMSGALRSNQPVNLFSDEWRTPIFSEDIVEAISQLCNCSSSGWPASSIFHLSGKDRISRYEFGELYCLEFGLDKNLLVASLRDDVESVVPRPKDLSLNHDYTAKTLQIRFRSPSAGLAAMAKKRF